MNEQQKQWNIKNGLRPRGVIFWLAMGLLLFVLCVGVYVGMFIGVRIFGGG